MTHRVFIDGEAGTTGLGIRDRLRDIPGLVVQSIDPARRKDPEARRRMMAECDLLVLCLPDDAARDAMVIATSLGDRCPRILDASTAFRVDPDWVYGFPELCADQPARIAAAARVSNPGCYPTGAIALLRPLIDAGLVPPDHPISIHAVSGYSGGGRTMIEAHEAQGGPAYEMYALGLDHKHVPEIMLHAGLRHRPIFLPAVGHFRQGMLVTIPLHLATLPHAATAERLRQVLCGRYAPAAQIAVLLDADNTTLDSAALQGTDRTELLVFGNMVHDHAVLVSRLDNLGKGASGAAVQNIRLMLGL